MRDHLQVLNATVDHATSRARQHAEFPYQTTVALQVAASVQLRAARPAPVAMSEDKSTTDGRQQGVETPVHVFAFRCRRSIADSEGAVNIQGPVSLPSWSEHASEYLPIRMERLLGIFHSRYRSSYSRYVRCDDGWKESKLPQTRRSVARNRSTWRVGAIE